MKKAIVLALAVILTLSLAVPAAAVSSPVAEETSQTTTAPLPDVVEKEVTTDDGAKVVIDLSAVNDEASLSNEAKETFAAAQESLAETAPAGMKAQYFFYATTTKVNADGSTESYDKPVDITLKIDNVTKVVVKQFVNGQWVELETVMNPDGTITIKGVVDGPMAIFTA